LKAWRYVLNSESEMTGIAAPVLLVSLSLV
jgi:hypothetical protein